MEAITRNMVSDTRETIEGETRYNTFEVLMSQVDRGEITFAEAVETYKNRELGATAIATM